MIAAAFLISSVISTDRGYVFSTGPRSGICSRVTSPVSHLDRIDNASISRNGRLIAFVEHAAPPQCGEDRVVILENGRRRIVGRPGVISNNAETFWVSHLRITDDGSVLATVEDDYSGAVMGQSEVTFRFESKTWMRIQNPFGRSANESLAGVSADSTVAVTTDHRNSPSGTDFISASRDKSVGADHSALVGVDTELLGIGTATSVSDTGFAAGYFANVYYQAGSCEALVWRGTSRSILGVGVAFGVDEDGAVVGDDRAHLDGVGRPVIWDHGTTRFISIDHGTANAIFKGTVAGSIDHVAFVMTNKKTLYSLKNILSPAWRESTGFALSATGDVLILGLRKNGLRDLILLRLRSPSAG